MSDDENIDYDDPDAIDHAVNNLPDWYIDSLGKAIIAQAKATFSLANLIERYGWDAE